MAADHHNIGDDDIMASTSTDDAQILELMMMAGQYIGFGRTLAILQLETVAPDPRPIDACAGGASPERKRLCSAHLPIRDWTGRSYGSPAPVAGPTGPTGRADGADARRS